jgi:hypothetical protein
MACVPVVSFINFHAAINFQPAGRHRARPFPPSRDARAPLIRSKAPSAPLAAAPSARSDGHESILLSL